VVTPSVLDEDLERRSKALFGNRHMLNVGKDIASGTGTFTVRDVALRTGVPYSSTHKLVRQLERLGLVTYAPVHVNDPQHRYQRERHKFWGAVQQLCVLTPGPEPKGGPSSA
jgi:hypothetical protein